MKNQRAQSVFEYIAIFCVLIVGIASAGFVPKIKGSFAKHYELCVDKILNRPAEEAKEIRERYAEETGQEYEDHYGAYSDGVSGYGEYANNSAYNGVGSNSSTNGKRMGLGSMSSYANDPYRDISGEDKDTNELDKRLNE